MKINEIQQAMLLEKYQQFVIEPVYMLSTNNKPLPQLTVITKKSEKGTDDTEDITFEEIEIIEQFDDSNYEESDAVVIIDQCTQEHDVPIDEESKEFVLDNSHFEIDEAADVLVTTEPLNNETIVVSKSLSTAIHKNVKTQKKQKSPQVKSETESSVKMDIDTTELKSRLLADDQDTEIKQDLHKNVNTNDTDALRDANEKKTVENIKTIDEEFDDEDNVPVATLKIRGRTKGVRNSKRKDSAEIADTPKKSIKKSIKSAKRKTAFLKKHELPMHDVNDEGESDNEFPARDSDNDDWPAQQKLDDFPKEILSNGLLLVKGKQLMTLICK